MDFQRLDIVQLINNSPLTKLSTEFHTKLLNKIQESFTDNQQQLFVASFYSYLNYNSKTDFVINLDDVWNWCGFTRRDNARRILDKHFTNDIDYKIFAPQVGGANFVPHVGGARDNRGGHNKETILMTINTFKKFCLKAGTKKADEIHDYYIKLEELMQDTLKEESDELRTQLLEQNKKIELLEHKPHTYGFNCWKKGHIYLINDILKPGHYKIGMATDPEKRVRNLNTGSSERSLRLYYEIETYDIELCERTIQSILQPFNIKGSKEWFYFSDDNQVKYAIHIMNNVKKFLDDFNFKSYEEFNVYLSNKLTNINLPNKEEINQNLEVNEKNSYKLCGQQMKNKTGNYKGVCFSKEKQKYKAELKRDYKISFLGYYSTELDAAKAYNDYALFVNNTENTNYTLNDIPNYISTPRDIPSITNKLQLENKTSKFRGVSYDSKRQYYVVSIKYKTKTYNLGNDTSDIECAKLYNQQALYFNNKHGTKYVLNDIPDYITKATNLIDFDKTKDNTKHTSKYYGVTFSKQSNKYKALLVYNKKQIHLGFFESELEAAKAYNVKAEELNKENNKKYKLNIFD
jgi:hypothetical protein